MSASEVWTLGIIGGSGLYDIEGLEDVREVTVETPFGATSDAFTTGLLGQTRLIFVPRHGRGHRRSPSEVPYRANIWALRKLGATAVLGVSAVGSMREEIAPGHVVVPSQLIDWTRGARPSTFFEDGIVAHVGFADPYCPGLRVSLADAVKAEGGELHSDKTLICMEGPQFSTRAESHLYRSWGVDIIGMTALPEAKLAREAELCYATLALSTDYDCWHETEEDVTVEAVLAIMKGNAELARRVVRRLAEAGPPSATCVCHQALEYAVMTAPELVPPSTRERLALFLERYGR